MSKIQVSKIILAVIFAVSIAAINPLNSKAQSSNSVIQHKIETNVKSNPSGTIQDLQSKLVDEYGVNGFRFVKNGELKEIANQKTLGAKELSNASGLDEYTIIIILAAIGAIAVILFIFK